MKKMLILLSGTPGSGKSTLAEKLAEEFNLKRIFASGIMRQIKDCLLYTSPSPRDS